jgi:HK97 family phage portal protein
MAWWSHFLERRGWKLSELQSWSDMGLTAPTAAGVPVSPETALHVPAVFACCQVLSQDVARTPLKLRRQTAPETFVDATEHPLYEILSALSNPEQTAYQVKHALQWQLLTHGRAYAEIVRGVDGRVEALWPLESSAMRVDRDATNRKRWNYTANGKPFTWLFDPSQPPILELTHESPILRCRDIIGTALALQVYVATFFANDARPNGVLQAAKPLTLEQKQQLRETWQKLYHGVTQSHKTAILEGGLEFKPLAMQHDHAQMTETMKALSTQICGAFRVPPWKAGLMESTNYSNMESGENTYVTSTLDPLFESWEEALRRDLLTARQYGAYTIQFDRSALVRNDVKSLYDSLSRGIQNGFLSQNDARKALGLNPIPNGDVYMVNTALQPIGAPHVA